MQGRDQGEGRGGGAFPEQPIYKEEIGLGRHLFKRGGYGKGVRLGRHAPAALDAQRLQRAAHDAHARFRGADDGGFKAHECGAAEDFHLFLQGQRDGKGEGASLPDLRLGPNLTAHVFDHVAGDAQAEPGPAVPPRQRGVGLFEGLEELR